MLTESRGLKMIAAVQRLASDNNCILALLQAPKLSTILPNLHDVYSIARSRFGAYGDLRPWFAITQDLKHV
jgi:hypothetical protein